jgi:hypothetical protein
VKTLDLVPGDGCHLWFACITERDRIEKLVASGRGTDGRDLTPENVAELNAKVERLKVLTEQAYQIWTEDLR